MNTTETALPALKTFNPTVSKLSQMTNGNEKNIETTSSSSTDTNLEKEKSHTLDILDKLRQLPLNHKYACSLKQHIIVPSKNYWKQEKSTTKKTDTFYFLVIQSYYDDNGVKVYFDNLFKKLEDITGIIFHSPLQGSLLNSAKVKFFTEETLILDQLQNSVVFKPFTLTVEDIKRETFGFLLGKQSVNKFQLENETNTQITFPRISSNSVIITVFGREENVLMTCGILRERARKRENTLTVNVQIEKIYLPFVQEIIKMSRATKDINVKFDRDPKRLDANICFIEIYGFNEDVESVRSEIVEMYTVKKNNMYKLSLHLSNNNKVSIFKPQRKFIEQVFEKFRVVLDFARENDFLHIVGDSDNMGSAVDYIIAEIKSFTYHTFDVPSWGIKYVRDIVGDAKLKKLRIRRSTEHENIDTIIIEGRDSSVDVQYNEIKDAVESVTNHYILREILVNHESLPHVIGRSGNTISAIRRDFNVIVNIIEQRDSDIVCMKITGLIEDVKAAAMKISDIHDGIVNFIHCVIPLDSYIISDNLIQDYLDDGKQGNKMKVNIERLNHFYVCIHLKGNDKLVKSVEERINKRVNFFSKSQNEFAVKAVENDNAAQYIKKNFVGSFVAEIKNYLYVVCPTSIMPEVKQYLSSTDHDVNGISIQKVEYDPMCITLLQSENNGISNELNSKFQVVVTPIEHLQKLIFLGPSRSMEKAKSFIDQFWNNLKKGELRVVEIDNDCFYRYISNKKDFFGKNVQVFKIRAKSSFIIHGSKIDVDSVEKKVNTVITDLELHNKLVLEFDPKITPTLLETRMRDISNLRNVHFDMVKIKCDEPGRVVIEGPLLLVNEMKIVLEGYVDFAISCVSQIISLTSNLTRVMTDFKKKPMYFDQNKIESKYNVAVSLKDLKKTGNMTVYGKIENIKEFAKFIDELEISVPTLKIVEMPVRLHYYFIGANGRNINRICDQFNVKINMPQPKSNSTSLTVEGNVEHVDKAVEHIESYIEVENKKVSRKLECIDEGGYKYLMDMGVIKRDNNVSIYARRMDSGMTLTITGDEKYVTEAENKIVEMLEKYSQMQWAWIQMDVNFHPRLIGSKGSSVIKLNNTFKVKVHFPRRDNMNSNGDVRIFGLIEDIRRCIAELKKRVAEMGGEAVSSLDVKKTTTTTVHHKEDKCNIVYEHDFPSMEILKN